MRQGEAMTGRKYVTSAETLRPDKRVSAVEPCDRCGGRSLCRRRVCELCGLIFSVCDRCTDETGGQAIEWELAGHGKRAHAEGARSKAQGAGESV